MRIATRLMLVLAGTVILIVFAYMALSHYQRQELLRDGLVRDTETLGRALQAGINHALADGRVDGLDGMLATAASDEEVFAGVVLDAAGGVMAGTAAELDCLRRFIPSAVLAGGEGGGWAGCSQRVYWHALPLVPPAASLVVAQRGVLLERSSAAALRRQVLLMLALALAIALVLSAILRHMVIVPLTEIRRGLQVVRERGEMPRIQVGGESAGELAELAATLNQMAEELPAKQREVLQQADDRLALERRLRDAEKFAVIGRLSGGMAHEMGSPLSVISIRAQALQLAPDSSATARQHAESIHAQVGRLTDFIQGLLHMAQQHGVVYNPLDLVELLHGVMDEIATRAHSEDVELEVRLPAAPVTVRGQETLLRHALRNLLRNSLHALQDSTGERRLRVGLELGAEEARVLVDDTGPGIPAGQIDRVFEPFYTTKDMGKGMGLGLPVTRGIVEEHGGELYLENLEPAGLRAVLVLPLDPGAERQGGEAAGERDPAGNPTREEP